MKKVILTILLLCQSIGYADISAAEARDLEIRALKIRKELGIHVPTAKEKQIERIRSELHLDFDTSSKDALLGNNKPKTVESLTVSTQDEDIADTIKSGLSTITETLGIKEKEEEEGYSLSHTLKDFYHTVGLEEGENWGMPSLFGLNKKKKKPLFGIGILGDIQDTGSSIFKGMKYSGQSAEFSSGLIYKSSKMYNTMFGMFEESPFNLFEEEDESSIFDVFEGGNKVLDMFGD